MRGKELDGFIIDSDSHTPHTHYWRGERCEISYEKGFAETMYRVLLGRCNPEQVLQYVRFFPQLEGIQAKQIPKLLLDFLVSHQWQAVK